jgi:hypothetical protein
MLLFDLDVEKTVDPDVSCSIIGISPWIGKHLPTLSMADALCSLYGHPGPPFLGDAITLQGNIQ